MKYPGFAEYLLKRAMLMIPLLFVALLSAAQVTFVIDDLPKGTSPEDSIYICGTFNNWSTGPRFMLHKRLDGRYAITLPIDSAFEYKFHRGDWSRVETSSRNQYMANRKYQPADGQTVHVFIANWQDLGGAKPFEIVSFFFFAMAFLCMAASYFLSQIRNRKKSRTTAVITFLIFLSVLLLGRVIIEVVSLPWQFQIGSVGDIAILLAGPLWLQLVITAISKSKLPAAHYLPALMLGLIFFVRFFNPPWLAFLTEPAIGSFVIWDDLLTYVVGALSVSAYLIAGLRFWRKTRTENELQENEIRFFRGLVVAGVVFALAYLCKVVVLVGVRESALLWFNRNLLVAGASLFGVLLCYYVFTFEDLFRVTQPVLRKTDDLENLKLVLHTAMKEHKLFINPHLTLSELSETVKIKPHVLSKIINDYYRQNFRDFVNGYRIEEFIDLASRETSKRFTFLALAFEVGFNSKSTFNVAFKKFTNVTPREYFMHNRGKSLKQKDVTGAAL